MTVRAAKAFAALVAVLCAPTVSCVNTEEVAGSYEPAVTTMVPKMTPAAVAEEFQFGGVVASINGVRAIDQSSNDIPRIAVLVRSENTLSSVQKNPDVVLLCDESSIPGDWFAGSTWEPNGLLRVNAATEGEVLIGFPLKEDNLEYPVVTCTNPMLRITMTRPGSVDVAAYSFEIDPEVIAEAIRHPVGAPLPLPAGDN